MSHSLSSPPNEGQILEERTLRRARVQPLDVRLAGQHASAFPEPQNEKRGHIPAGGSGSALQISSDDVQG